MDALREALRCINGHPGSVSLSTLVRALRQRSGPHGAGDAVRTAITRLFEWGLIEILKNRIPVRRDSLDRLLEGDSLKGASVRFTQAAAALASELGLRLDGSVPLFGIPPAPPSGPPLLFVVMPFDSKLGLEPVLQVIRDVGAARGLEVQRGDDVYSDKVVMDEIWSSIYHARLVVADCTGRNANVLYEIGLAHAAGRPVILLTQTIEDIPFDLRLRRALTYSTTPAGMAELARKLGRTVAAVLAATEPGSSSEAAAERGQGG